MRPECDTRGKLLTAATELMWESSYGSVSVDDICLRADVRKGSFYYFFPSKCDLTVAAIGCLWEKSRPLHDEIFSPQTNPLQRFPRHCEMILESQRAKLKDYGKVCGCPYLTLGAEMSTQEEKIRQKIAETGSYYRRYYEATLRELMEDGHLAPIDITGRAQQIFSFVTGSILQAKIANDLQPISALWSGVALFLNLGAGRQAAPVVPAGQLVSVGG